MCKKVCCVSKIRGVIHKWHEVVNVAEKGSERDTPIYQKCAILALFILLNLEEVFAITGEDI